LAARAIIATLVVCAVTSSCGGTTGCRLTMSYGKKIVDPGGQSHVNLVFANTGGSCKLSGFPAVELLGPGDPYVLPQQVVPGGHKTIGHGQKARARLTWLPGNWPAERVRARVGTARLTLRWPFGPVLRQDGATHPGTYIGPLKTTARSAGSAAEFHD
jgi:hypothetical protein